MYSGDDAKRAARQSMPVVEADLRTNGRPEWIVPPTERRRVWAIQSARDKEPAQRLAAPRTGEKIESLAIEKCR